MRFINAYRIKLLFVTSLFITIIVYFSIFFTRVWKFSESSNDIISNGTTTPVFQDPTSQYLIDGTDRFLWYQERRQEFLMRNKVKKAEMKMIMSLSEMHLFHAYEYDFEYSVSHLTPNITGADVFCRYFDNQNKEIEKPVKAFTFPEYVVNCPKRKGTKKISISMTKNGSYDVPRPLHDRKQNGLKYKLSLCLSPIYGDEPKWLMLIELIEHYKLQGVDHVYIYIYNIDEYSNRTINDYVRSGDVEVIRITDYLNREGEKVQRLMYRDCTLRSRGESKWSIFADLDERLTMTNYSGTILDFMNNIKDDAISLVVFRQQYVKKTELMPEKYEGKQQILNWMPTRRWLNTSGVASRAYSVKTILDPKKVFSMWTHFPEIIFPGYSFYELTPEEGVVRHYRDLKMGDWGMFFLYDINKFGPFHHTNYSAGLIDQLTENVQKRVLRIYGEAT